MTEQSVPFPSPSPASPKRKARPFLAGRGDRKEYWIGMGVLFGIGLVCAVLGFDVGSAGSVPSFFLMVRRVHDQGHSGWWLVPVMLGPVGAMLLLIPLVGLATATVAGLVLSLIPTVWIGLVRGEPTENRFGPPPGKQALNDVFA